MRQRRKGTINEQKASLIEKEKSLDDKGKKVKNFLTAVLYLLMEGNENMKSAVEDDISKVATAQFTIYTAITKTGEYNKKFEEIRKKQELDRRKLLENFLDVNSKQEASRSL
jgi:hypothetical protein